MNHLRTLRNALLGIVIVLLSSCIDGHEEIWLNANGSGRADFTYEIPATAARLQGGIDGVNALLDSVLKDFPTATREVTQTGDRLKVNVKIAFDSPDEISKITSSVSNSSNTPKAFEHLAGIFDVTRNFLTVDFTRTVSPGKALPTAFIPASEFKGRKLTYILHLPVVPTESTADRIEDGGLTHVWEQSLTSAIRKPMVIHFKAKIPVPDWVIGLSAALVGAVALLIRRLMIRRNAAPEDVSPPSSPASKDAR